MLGNDAVRDLARAAGFSEIAEDLAGLGRPALLLEPDPASREVGRLGGLPRLPPQADWPHARWPDVTPEPLTFIAEFDLAALSASFWPGPRTGTLSVFCHIDADALYADTGGAALVLHHPAGTRRSWLPVPDELDEDLRYDAVPVGARDVTTLPWVGVEPARELVPLGLDAMEDLPRAERYCELACQVSDSSAWGTPHQLLGWPRFTQGDVSDHWPLLHDQAVATGLSSGEVAPEDWRLLLQIGSDERLGTTFGDGGDLFFGIPGSDLAAGRFDRVQAITDSG